MKKEIKRLLTISLIVLAIVAITIPVKAATSTTNNTVEKVKSDSNEDKYQIADGTIIIGKSKFTPGVIVTGESASIAGANDLAIYISENKTNSGYQYPKMYIYTFGEWYQYVDGRATKQVSMDSVEIWYINNVLKDGLTEPILEEPAKPVTKYNVLFVSGEENKILDEIQIEEGKTVETVPDAKRDGYELIGWTKATPISTDTTEVELDKVSSEKITSDTIFFAKWSQITKFNVSLDEVGKSKTDNALVEAIKKLGYDGNYDTAGEDKLTLSDDKLSGLIEITPDEKIPDTTFSGAKKTGYYFAYVLDVEGTVTEATTVTLKSNGEEKSIPYTAFDDKDNGKMAILVSLDKNASDKTTSVVVDLDGEGNKYVAKSYTIDWSGVKFQQTSAGVALDLDKAHEGDFADVLKSVFNFTGNPISVKFEKGVGNTYNLTGELPKVKNIKGYGNNDNAEGHFFAFVLETPINVKSKADLEILEIPEDSSSTKKVKAESFDTDNGIAIIFKLSNSGNKKINITVDLDGSKDEYLPETYVIDYTGLTLEEASKTAIKSEINETDKQTLQSKYGYDFEQTYEIEKTEVLEENHIKVYLEGYLKEQTINENVYGDERTTGHFFAFELKPDVFKDTIKITLDRATLGGEKVYTKADFGEDEFLTLLRWVKEDEETKECTFTIDLDGDGKEYGEYKITIDYSKLVLQEDSEIASIARADKTNIAEEDIKTIEGWKYNFENGDTITVSKEDDNKIMISGTVREQRDVTAFDGEEASGYYVPLKIVVPEENKDTAIFKVRNKKNSTSEMKTLDNEQLTKTETETYLTLLLATYNEGDKTTTIEIDLDGEENKYKPTTYTIDYSDLSFVQLYAKVTSEVELQKALEDVNIVEIQIAGDFDITKQHAITRRLTINGAKEDSGNYTITAKAENDIASIFVIKTQNVKINNLNLVKEKSESTEAAIIVEENGILTSDKLGFTGSETAGVEVKVGGTFNGTNLSYTDEKYDNPLVKAQKDSQNKKATVNVDNNALKATTVEEIIPYDGKQSSASGTINIGEKKQEKANYNYKHYYLNSEVANRWIKLNFIGNRAITGIPVSYVLYYDKESGLEHAPEPENIEYLTYCSSGGVKYKVTHWKGDEDNVYNTGELPLPTAETSYSAEYTAEYGSNVEVVKDEAQLKSALGKSEITTIIVANEINLKEELKIERGNIVIIGSESKTDKVLGVLKGKITVSANNVIFEQIKIVGKTGAEKENDKYVVTVTGKNFRSSQSEFTAEDGNWDSLLYYDIAEPCTVLFHNKFIGGNTKVYVEFAKTLDGSVIGENNQVTTQGSSFTGNDFIDKGNEVTFIKMKDIKENTTINIAQTDLQMNNENTKFLELSAKPEGSNIKLYLSNIWVSRGEQKKVKILVNTDTEKDASGITLEKYSASTIEYVINYSGEHTGDLVIGTRS